MKEYLLIGIIFGMLLLAGCGQTQTQEQAQEQQGNGQIVGGDRDEHGCIPSAGYSWCETKRKCYRPWEETCPSGQGKETSPGVECVTVADCGLGAARCVDGKCTQYDEHGCVPDGGYTWCEPLQKCIRPWEEECPSSGGETAIEKKAREFCGKENVERVYVCGEYIRTVTAMIGGGSTIYDASGKKLSDCPMVNPEYFDATCRKVLMENYCEEKEIC
ncbi:MAG: hypothetical protein QXH30_01475 [Candidatus Bilamarchaeaceae archaeon]